MLIAPNPIDVVPLVCAAALALAYARARGDTISRLEACGAGRAALRLNDLRAIAAVAALALVGVVRPAPVQLAMLALSAVLALPGPRLVTAIPGMCTPERGLRTIWDSLEAIAFAPDDPAARDRRRASISSLVGALPAVRTDRTARVVDGLVEQAPRWLSQTELTRDFVVREIQLYEDAAALWPANPPWARQTSLGAQFLWELYAALDALNASVTTDGDSGDSAEHLDLARDLDRFRRRETARLIDLRQRLALLDITGSSTSDGERQQVEADLDREMVSVFPSEAVFRGAHIERFSLG